MLKRVKGLITNRESNSIQAFWLGIGSLIAFSFSILSAAILSRYLRKEDYGTYRQVLYVYSTLLVVFSVGLPRAYSHFLPIYSMGEAKEVTKKITNVFFVLGFLFSLMLYFSASLIANVLKNPDLEIGLKYFSPIPFLMLPTMGIEGIYATYKKSITIAIYTVYTRVLMLLFIALPVIYFSNNVLTAIKGFVFSSLLSFLVAIYLKYTPFKNIVSIATSLRYKDIIKFSLPLMYASIAGVLISAADQFFISRYFGKGTFAEFSNGSLQLPFVAMITGAVSTVLQPQFSRMKNEGRIGADFLPLWKSAIEKSSIIIYPLVIFFWFYSDYIMVALYGHLYLNSSIYFKISSLINLFSVVTYLPLILALSETKFYANVHWFMVAFIWLSEFLIVSYFRSPYLITVASVLCKMIVVVCMVFLISNRLKVKVKDLFPVNSLVKILVSCVAIILSIKFLTGYFQIKSILLLVLSFSIYYALLISSGYLTKIRYLNVFTTLFSKR